MTRRLLLVGLLLVGLAPQAAAQSYREIGPLGVGAANAFVALDTKGMGTAAISVDGTYSGTLTFEVVTSDGNTASINCTPPNSTTAATTTTSTGRWGACNVAGFPTLRVRMSSYSSGTANVTLSASAAGGGGSSSVSGTFSGNAAASATGAAVPSSADYQGINIGGNITGVTGVSVGSARAPTVAVVDGSGTQITSFGGGTQYTEDAAETAAAALTMAGTVRRDTAASSAGLTGDNATLNTNATGKLWTDAEISVALPAGTNAIGKLAANSGVDIGDVDVTSSALPTGASTSANQSTEITALQLIDNLPNTLGSTTSGQSGALALGAVTTASPSYTTAQTNALSLDTAGSLRVAIVSGAGSGGTALADGGTFTPSTTSATPASGLYEASPSTCTTGKACAVGISPTRALRTTLETAAGVAYSQDTQGTHDTALGTITSVTGGLLMGRASAAAPTDVSADGDAVIPWLLRSGASVTQPSFAGIPAVAGSGVIGTGVQRVNIATDDPVNDALVKLDAAIVIEDAAETPAANLVGVGTVRRATAASSAGAAGDNATLNTDTNGLMWARMLSPCSALAPTTTAISLTADTVIIAASASNRTYICSISVVAGAAEIVSITEGTGSVCGTGEAALVGSTTDANGMSFAANGGLAAVGGNAAVIATAGTNVDTCMNVSGSNRVSGFVTWVQAP